MTPFGMRLRELFDLDDEMGEFFRKETTAPNALKGEMIGTWHNGYIRTNIDGTLYYVHRLVWYWHHDKWPDNFIDHINGEKADNRIANLRDASHSLNSRNRRGQDIANSWIHDQRGKFIVRICLTSSDTHEEARQKRDLAIKLLFEAGLLPSDITVIT